MSQNEGLTQFLRSARARVQPSDWGLAIERRLSKGLRREKVAALSGMSVTWYTRFEQGRDIQLSTNLLERLAHTLKLSSREGEFLFAYARRLPLPLDDPDSEADLPANNILDS